MKPFSLSVLLLLSAMAASADVTMVKGTIYDVGKGSHSNQGSIPNKEDDRLLCWAATSANLIQHWQDRYMIYYPDCQAPNGTQEGYSQPSGTRYLKIFDLFRENFSNGGAPMSRAVDWYFNGDRPVGINEDASEGGYYKGYGISNNYFAYRTDRTGSSYFGDVNGFRRILDQAFCRDGIGVFLGIAVGGGSSYHAITCWGYETNANNEMVALYLTDSDDKQFGARRVELESRDGKIYIKGSSPAGSYYDGADYIDHVSFLTSAYNSFVVNMDNIKLTSSLINSNNGSLNKAVDATGQQVTSSKGITLEAGALLTAAANKNTRITLGASSGTVDGDGLVARMGSMLNLRDGDVSISHFAGNGLVAEAEAYVTGGNLSITDNQGAGVLIDCTWSDNRVYLGITDNDSVTISGNQDSGVQVHGAGKAYSSQYYEGHSEISNNTDVEIAGNSAAKGGGVFAGDTFYINNNESVTFSGNTATDIGGAVASVREVFADQSSVPGNLNISNNTTVKFENNNATNAGGAAYANDTLNIKDNTSVTFSGNSAAQGGAVASSWDENKYKGDVNISGNTSIEFKQNHATGGTGGALLSSGSLTLANNDSLKFTGNTATQGGGAVSSWDRGTMTFSGNKDVTFSGNTTEADGGAIRNNSKLYITGGTGTLDISGNRAVNGSAVYNATERVDYYWRTSTMSIDNNATVYIRNNVSSGADVIYNQGVNFTLSNNGDVTISGNDAGSGSVFHNVNEILRSGGKVFTDGNDHVMEIAHNQSVTFADNKATYDIYNEKTLYLSADKGQTITFQKGFKNSSPNDSSYTVSGGTTYLGKDAAGATSTGGKYIFADKGHSVSMETAVATVKVDGGMVYDGSKLEVSKTDFASTDIKFTLESSSLKLSEVTFVDGASLTVDFGYFAEKNKLTLDDVTRTGASNVGLSMLIDLVDARATQKTTALASLQPSTGLETQVFSARQNGTVIHLADYLNENVDLRNFSLSLLLDGWRGEGDELAVYTDGYNLSEVTVMADKYTYDRTEAVNGGQVLYYYGKALEDIPEPATATLSLLALAGLAARRRRKCA